MKHRIEVKELRDGWYGGKVDGYLFQAKVYDTGSKFGINNGRVSKLEVWDEAAGVAESLIRYDRGWDKKPASDVEWELLWNLLSTLEALPASEDTVK